jgi:hypothetical protein
MSNVKNTDTTPGSIFYRPSYNLVGIVNSKYAYIFGNG